MHVVELLLLMHIKNCVKHRSSKGVLIKIKSLQIKIMCYAHKKITTINKLQPHVLSIHL